MRAQEEEVRLQVINSVLAHFKDDHGPKMMAGCSYHGFNSVTAKQYLQLCMFLMKKLFGYNVSFGDEDEQISNVIHVITQVLDCPIGKKIRKSDFKTPTAINSKSVCILLLHWLSEEVAAICKLNLNDSHYTLSQSTLVNLFSEQENDSNNSARANATSSSTSNVSYKQFETQLPSTSTLAQLLPIPVQDRNNPPAALFKKYFHNVDVDSKESFQMAMEILDSEEKESSKKLESCLVANAKLKTEFLQLSDAVEKEEALVIEISIKIENALLRKAEKELALKATWAEYDQLNQAKQENKNRAHGRAAFLKLNPNPEEAKENSSAYLKVKLKTLLEKLEEQETRRTDILDKYLEEVPFLNTQISKLNELFERVDIDCVPSFYPPLSTHKLNTWMKAVIANCGHCSNEIKREIELLASKGKNQTDLFSSDTTDTSEDGPRILPFNANPNSESSSTESDTSENRPRILIPSDVSISYGKVNPDVGTDGLLRSASGMASLYTLPFSSPESSLTD